MSEAVMRAWLAASMGAEVAAAIERLRRAEDVVRVAVMPDVHLAADVCIGVAVATRELIFPQAVGGDIGCGVLAVATDGRADALRDGRVAGAVLAELGRVIPARRRRRDLVVFDEVALEAARWRDAELEFATLGSGNHFLELQADEEGRLWLMVHSGSRAVGPAIRDRWLKEARAVGQGLRALEARSDAGQRYLADVELARRYAAKSRQAMARMAGEVLERRMGARVCWESAIETDHNHVARERHGGKELWVHRKGAMRAGLEEEGV
ncbi:MAG: RtcB family protein, partial [Acidobacteria bacterium]|nr:RtcB family protein [Acidobacteriota bacterium]